MVQVEGGTYPQQDITADSSKSSSADVVLVPEPGKVVTIGCHTTGAENSAVISGASCIDDSASHITFDGGASQGFRSATYSVKGFSYQGRFDTERGARDVTFTNMDVGSFAIGSSQTTISHNDIGPSVDPLNNRQADGDGDVWADNLIHDFPIKNGGHFECLTWDAGTNVTFEHNEFRSCAIFAIFSKPDNATSGRIDHNVFWNPTSVQTNDDIKVSNGAGAPRCDTSVTNNWISNGLDLSTAPCPGAVDGGGNTHHSPRTKPPSPIRH